MDAMYKRVLAGFACLLVLVLGVYVVYFRHPAADDVLAANKARRNILSGPRGRFAIASQRQSGEDYDYYDDADFHNASPQQQAQWKWDAFIDANGYVSIGEFYDKCDGDDRIMLGRTVLMEDKENGGLKSLSFINFTLPEEVTGGWMYFECQYNGKDLYANHWDICTVEDDMSSPKIIHCPVTAGKKKLIKHLGVPSYIPKGTYTMKSWLVDQNDRLFVCSYSEFTI